MRHAFVVTVRNVPGILSRVESLFRRQGLPLSSLTFEEAASDFRRGVHADAPPPAAALVARQLRRLVDVAEVREPALVAEPAAETVPSFMPV